MTRTTLDLDDGVLEALRARKERDGKPIGTIASELLARALHDELPPPPDLVWHSAHLGLRLDLDDKDALWAALDEP